jgi:hypothetical protein
MVFEIPERDRKGPVEVTQVPGSLYLPDGAADLDLAARG